MQYAGFWRRVLAYLVDILPITLLVAAVFYTCFGFDEAVNRYLRAGPADLEARRAFLAQRNLIRDTALLIYVLYSAALESTSLQGSLGKRLIGIVVTDGLGQRLGFGRALSRNICKILSFACCGLGALWVAWSKEKRGWHDYIAATLVILDGRR